MSARPARVVGVKLASIAWAAALVAVGLDLTLVTADDGHAATVTALRGATDVLAIGASTKGRAASKAGRDLLALHGEYQTYVQVSDAPAREPSGFTSRNPLAWIAEGYVVIDTAGEGDPKALASDLEALGLEDPAVFGRMVSGRLPIPAIPALENLASLRFARPAYAMTLAGIVTSQGDAAMRTDIGRTAFGVDGTGVMVGTLSDSYDCLGGTAIGVASRDLPAGVTVLDELNPCTGATDEGRGMMEIIHDVAPGASQAFHTAFEGQPSFAQGIIALANAGARVITDDVIYFADTAGNRLTIPEVRQQPDITAPDGADTTFFGTDTDSSGFPNFFGTSAAAPHAAGIGALITEHNPSFAPDNLYSVLKSTAIDMDDPVTTGIFDTGFDPGTGHGLVQADAALDRVPPLGRDPARRAPDHLWPRRVPGPAQLSVDTVDGDPMYQPGWDFVRAGILRRGPDSGVPATRQRLIRFATVRASLEPGETRGVRLLLTGNGKRIVRQRNLRRFSGQFRVTSGNGAAVSNTPITIRIR